MANKKDDPRGPPPTTYSDLMRRDALALSLMHAGDASKSIATLILQVPNEFMSDHAREVLIAARLVLTEISSTIRKEFNSPSRAEPEIVGENDQD